MASFHRYKFVSSLLLVLFLLMRVTLSAHAAEYGNVPHQHDGKVCTLALASPADENPLTVLPSAPVLPPPPSKEIFVRTSPIMLVLARTISARARSPPAL